MERIMVIPNNICGVGPECEKGDGRLRPSLQQRLPGAEGPPEGCSTAPRHAACGAPVPSSRGHFLSFGGDRNQLQRRDADGARCDSERRWRAAADRRQSIRRFLQLLAVRRVERALRAARPLGLGR